MPASAYRPILDALTGAHGPASGLRLAELVERAACSEHEVRSALKTLLELEPAWIDGDVDPDRGMVWWLTHHGATAAA